MDQQSGILQGNVLVCRADFVLLVSHKHYNTQPTLKHNVCRRARPLPLQQQGHSRLSEICVLFYQHFYEIQFFANVIIEVNYHELL